MLEREISLALYQKLYLIRQATQAARREYPSDLIRTPVHLSMGEEAIAAGISHALAGRALFCGTYRNHGFYLSLTLETDKFFAELYGKKSGVAGGKAGSMHLTAKEAGLICTSAVVGTTIPIAVGAAFAQLRFKTDKIAVVFFGDGALDEGVFWESFNLACVMCFPVIFVCEDNGLATHTKAKSRQGYDSINKVLSGFNSLWSVDSHTTDVEEIFKLAGEAGEAVRKTRFPAFMHLRYYRYLEHVGPDEDFKFGYRDKAELLKWQKVDPVKLQRDRLVQMGLESEVNDLEKKITFQIEKSVTLAKVADFPDRTELFKGVLA